MVIKKPIYPGLIAVALISTIAPTALAQTPCPDADTDGWAVCDAVCQLDPGDQCGDCDDADANRFPGNTDVCDGLDNDCDGPADEDFPEVGQVCTADVGACEGIGITVCGGAGVGTFMVKDINPGPGDGAVQNPANLNGVLLFFADDGTHGSEPWISDGSEQGTVLLKDINPGPDPSYGFRYRPAIVGDVAFFYADDGVNGFELWMTDGTESGTVLVRDINPGPGDSRPEGNDRIPIPTLGVGLDGVLLFGADDGVDGLELWKSDGTDLGTVLVKDINPGPGGSLALETYDLRFANVDGTVFLPARGTLWKSDGTGKGTVSVKDPGGPGSVRELTGGDGTVFFIASYEELWKSDGTDAGTFLLRDYSNTTENFTVYGDLTDVGGTLLFRAYDIGFGEELWKSDGTVQGTVLVKDVFPGSWGSLPIGLTDVQGTLFFICHYCSSTEIFRLWKSDGTEAGTHEVRIGGVGSPWERLRDVGGTLFFGSLWKSDGTPQGTVRVREGLGIPHPSGFTDVDGILFFYADDGSGSGHELWMSDGTADGTECDALTGTPTPEVCGDGIDNDCNGDTDDEDGVQSWCADVDTDTYGDPDTATRVCTELDGLVPECTDCDDTNPQLWAVPGETGTAVFLSDKTTLGWEAPVDSGGSQVTVAYDVIRSPYPEYFGEGSTCVYDGTHYETTRTEAAVPPPGIAWYYVVVAWNSCGGGSGGTMSSGAERRPRDCH